MNPYQMRLYRLLIVSCQERPMTELFEHEQYVSIRYRCDEYCIASHMVEYLTGEK